MMFFIENRYFQSQQNGGFIAVVSVLLVSIGTLAIIFVSMIAVSDYSEMISLAESRYLARKYMDDCIDFSASAISADYFISGNIRYEWLYCDVSYQNDLEGLISADLIVAYGPVKVNANQSLVWSGVEPILYERSILRY